MDQHKTTEGEASNSLVSPSFLNSFDIVVFGLEDRVDRWQRCREILEGKVKKVTHYTTHIQEDRWKGTTKDFLNLLRLKDKTFLFFEDDFELTDGWEDVLKKAWVDLPEDFDILYLGVNLTKTPKKVTENLYQVRGAWCFHAVVLSQKFIRYALKAYDVNRRQVFDEWCRNQADQRKFYMTYPMISYQRKSYSDYVRRVVYYDIFQNKYYAHINHSSRISSPA